MPLLAGDVPLSYLGLKSFKKHYTRYVICQGGCEMLNDRSRGGPRRTQKERSRSTRLALIEGMMSALIELGYVGTTTPEITRRSKVTSGALQHHFSSKDELLLAVLQHHFDEMQNQLETFVAKLKGRSREGDWRAFISLLKDIYSSDRYIAVWEIVLGSRGDPHLHTKVMQHRIQSLGILGSIWKKIFSGHFRNKQRATDLMHFTLATMRGFVFYNVIAPDKAFFNRQLDLLVSFITIAMREDEEGRKPNIERGKTSTQIN
jgi:AcrR family transcriptional regulator